MHSGILLYERMPCLVSWLSQVVPRFLGPRLSLIVSSPLKGDMMRRETETKMGHKADVPKSGDMALRNGRRFVKHRRLSEMFNNENEG